MEQEMKDLSYIILTSYAPSLLTREVTNYIEAGWAPAGGVCCSGAVNPVFYQAMTRTQPIIEDKIDTECVSKSFEKGAFFKVKGDVTGGKHPGGARGYGGTAAPGPNYGEHVNKIV